MAAENDRNQVLHEARIEEERMNQQKEGKKLAHWKKRRTVYKKAGTIAKWSGVVAQALLTITGAIETFGGDIKTPLLSTRGLWYVVGDAFEQAYNTISQLIQGKPELFNANITSAFGNLRYEQVTVQAALGVVTLGVLLHKLAKKRKVWEKISKASPEEARLYKDNTARNFENGKKLGIAEGLVEGKKIGYNNGVISEQARIVQSYAANQPYTFMANGQRQEVAVTPYLPDMNPYAPAAPAEEADLDRGRQMGGSDL